MRRQIPLAQLDAATDERVLLRTAIQGVDDAATALEVLATAEPTTARVRDAEEALEDALRHVRLLKRGLATTQTRLVRSFE